MAIASSLVDTLLQQYDIDPKHGFLPASEPLTRLPAPFAAWEDLAQELPKLLAVGRIRQEINALPQLDHTLLEGIDQINRAMLLLSYFGASYVYGEAPIINIIPAQIAIPWFYVAQALGRPPVLSYASHALYNWRRFDSAASIELGNIARLENFLGGVDEDWFVLVHVAIEAKAAKGIKSVVEAQEAVSEKDAEMVVAKLCAVAASLTSMLETLQRMPEKCDPYIYYTRVRPFIFGWKDNPAFPEGVHYEGVDAYQGKPQTFRGETGAQSSIIPALDNALGIVYENNPLLEHLIALRDYMPPRHREFVLLMQSRPSIRAFVLRHCAEVPSLADAYNECLTFISRFRSKHLEYAGAYIHAQSQRNKANPVEVGTGGTPFMKYLKQHEREMQGYLVN
jgi:indoleamine 2,3-dioxygenase